MREGFYRNGAKQGTQAPSSAKYGENGTRARVSRRFGVVSGTSRIVANREQPRRGRGGAWGVTVPIERDYSLNNAAPCSMRLPGKLLHPTNGMTRLEVKTE